MVATHYTRCLRSCWALIRVLYVHPPLPEEKDVRRLFALVIVLYATIMLAFAGSAQSASSPSSTRHYTSAWQSPDGSLRTEVTYTFDRPVDAAKIRRVAPAAGPVASSVSALGMPNGAVIACNRFYSFSDTLGTYTLQHACGGTATPWSFRLSGTVQATVVGTVNEPGMQWWVNGVPRPRQAAHPAVSPSYLYHGTYSSTRAGHGVAYADSFSYRHNIGSGGSATVRISGRFTLGPDSGGCGSSTPC